ncbi:hypothetical protein VTN31DRAFT_2405 [Thermomyces dupontii]|uniref:uncharacterized protein n=1 Tax=Talaromyces thermophilus TaxID=28565 RepID=UPI00374414C5
MVALVMSVHSSASFPDGTAKLSSENVFGWFNMPKVRRFSERITALQFIKTNALVGWPRDWIPTLQCRSQRLCH